LVATLAKHLLVEYHGCDRVLLNDRERLRTMMVRAAEAAGATVVAEVFHDYRPQGVTGVVVIEESHLALHTWPECGYAAIDFYTCGACVPEAAAELLRIELSAERVETLLVRRGIEGERSSIAVDGAIAARPDGASAA